MIFIGLCSRRHALGKGGVESSILSGGTIPCNRRAGGTAQVQKFRGGEMKRRRRSLRASQAFAAIPGRIAVKVINRQGDEVMKVFGV